MPVPMIKPPAEICVLARQSHGVQGCGGSRVKELGLLTAGGMCDRARAGHLG